MSLLGSGIQDIADDVKAVKGMTQPDPVPVQPPIDIKAGIKAPVYHKGIAVVPKTGPAILEKGEAVVSKENNPMSHLADMMGGKDEKPAKEIHEIRTRKAHGGGFIHKHVHTHPEHHKDEEHVSANQDGMVSHMLEHMGTPNPGEAEADAGQSGVPDAAPAATPGV